MGLRKHRIEAPADAAPPSNPSDWHDIRCRLITPLYGGGVQAATVDETMPIRISALRGQLRFWWRLLAAHKWHLPDLRRAEFQLWGGMGSDDTEASASLVFLRVRNVRDIHKVPYTDYADNRNAPLAYVFFPADNDKNTDVSHDVLREGLHFTLQLRFATIASETQRQQVIETLRWWANFGGLGARNRRGTGAVQIEQADSLPSLLNPVTKQEAEEARCCLTLRQNSSNNPVAAWKQAITRLRDFRQKAGLGRNLPGKEAGNKKPAGRSRWPEADAVRRLSGQHAAMHAPEHLAGNVFPRGMFGMPIIFHFVGRGEPADHQVQPQGKDRMPSPLILRPYHDGNGQWFAAALLLPHDLLQQMSVVLQRGSEKTYPAKLWEKRLAASVEPIKTQQADDPLHAFLHYFAAP